MNKKYYSIPFQSVNYSKDPILKIEAKDIPSSKPVVSITFCDIMSKEYGLKGLLKSEKKSDRDLLKELDDFLIKARQYDNIEELVSAHISHNHGKNEDKKSKDKLKHINNAHNVDAKCMIHLHTKTGGNGKFVFHGFVVNNVFEIVWIDPFHKLHS